MTEIRLCQLLMSHSINTSLENPVSRFQELRPRRRSITLLWQLQ